MIGWVFFTDDMELKLKAESLPIRSKCTVVSGTLFGNNWQVYIWGWDIQILENDGTRNQVCVWSFLYVTPTKNTLICSEPENGWYCLPCMQVTFHFTISTTLAWFHLFWSNRCGECQWLMGSGICCGQKWVCYHYLTSRALPLISMEQCNKLHICSFHPEECVCVITVVSCFVHRNSIVHFLSRTMWEVSWATLHCGQGPWPWNWEALETHPKARLWKLRLNFVWPWTFKSSVRCTTGLLTKCYFVTISSCGTFYTISYIESRVMRFWSVIVSQFGDEILSISWHVGIHVSLFIRSNFLGPLAPQALV
jgi:hypothetical protein